MATPGQLQMYNKVETLEMFSLDDRAKGKDGVKRRIHIIPDEKVPDAYIFKIWIEDHTLGHTLRMELLRNDNVIFVGYKVPHPLDHMIEIRVQTLPKSSPEIAIRRAIANIRAECKSMLEQFDQGVVDWQASEEAKFAKPKSVQGALSHTDTQSEGGSRHPAEEADRTLDARFNEQLGQLEREGEWAASDYSPTYSHVSQAAAADAMSDA